MTELRREAENNQSLRDPSGDDRRDARPLRVIHVINGLELGGAETLLYRLVTRQSANEHVVVALGQPGWYSSRLQERGVDLHHLRIDSPRTIAKGLVRLNRIIRQSGADVVQCWMYRSNLVGGLLAQAARKPVVWGIHCSSLEPLKSSSRALVYLSGLLARWNPDFVINCSARSAQLHEKLGFSAAAGAVIHNGYDPEGFFPDARKRAAARKRLGIGPHQFAVGTIARWHPQKDIPNFLAAARIAHEQGVPLRCFLVGAGLDKANPELASQIADACCSGFVTCLGARSDLPDLARALDLNVLASCGSEAFPNVVAESMLAGTPNVVTDVGDAALMVGESGWVVPPRDPRQLAQAIIDAYRQMVRNPAQWSARRNASRSRIADNFSFDRMMLGYEEVWRKVLVARFSN